jgi:hypothetical protein
MSDQEACSMSHEVLGVQAVPQFRQDGIHEQGGREEAGVYQYNHSVEHPSLTTPPTALPSLTVQQIRSFIPILINCHIPAILFNGYGLLELAAFHPTVF